MSLSVTCPHCGNQTIADEKYAGTSGPCRACGKTITIPANPFAEDATTPIPPTKSSSAWVPIVVVLGVVGVIAMLSVGMLVALLLPAVQAAREAARRSVCMNNLRQIQLAILNYEAANGVLPPAYLTDEQGQPMHSWRVLILPYLEEQALFERYDMELPWDSPENLAVTRNYCPAVFQCPSNSAASTNTDYLGISGPGMFFDGSNTRTLGDITDGTSRTMAVVEVFNSTVHWAEPRDLDTTTSSFQMLGQADEFGSQHPGGFGAVHADGHVEFVDPAATPASLRAQATIAGNDGL